MKFFCHPSQNKHSIINTMLKKLHRFLATEVHNVTFPLENWNYLLLRAHLSGILNTSRTQKTAQLPFKCLLPQQQQPTPMIHLKLQEFQSSLRQPKLHVMLPYHNLLSYIYNTLIWHATTDSIHQLYNAVQHSQQSTSVNCKDTCSWEC